MRQKNLQGLENKDNNYRLGAKYVVFMIENEKVIYN